jgi:bifunctional UDP-N-acetylglucosamine pyrophosphorylase/glucosamine-1-phosphate N-acetyltransferase
VQYPWDLLHIQEQVLAHAPHGRNNGIIHEGSVIDGNVALGDGSIILPGVSIFGNVIIGENCEIGPNCCIRGNTAIGDRCRIGQGAEVNNSIIMDDVKISHVSYVGDSIIASGVDVGAGTMIASYRHDGENVKSMVNGKLVDTGRKYFGAVFAEGARTSVNTAILPGRKISANLFTLPGDIIRHDLE